ncbi:MAG: hypothetical protein ACTSYA_12470 [Candidatus Kariarchaeaceae archaeon]
MIIWLSYWKVSAKSLWRIGLPIGIIFLILLQTNSFRSHISNLQTSQLNEDNYPSGHFVLKKEQTVLFDTISGLSQYLEPSNVNLFFSQTQQKHSDFSFSSQVLSYITLSLTFYNSSNSQLGTSAYVLLLNPLIEQMIWGTNLPTNINEVGYVFPFIADALYKEERLSQAKDGQANITSIDSQIDNQTIPIHLQSLDELDGYSMRTLAKKLVIPEGIGVLPSIIIVRETTFDNWFEGKIYKAYSQTVLLKYKLWITSYQLLLDDSFVLNDLKNEIDDDQIVHDYITPTLETQADVIKLTQLLINGIQIVLILFLFGVFIENWDIYLPRKINFINKFKGRGHNTSNLQSHMNFLDNIVIYGLIFVILLLLLLFCHLFEINNDFLNARILIKTISSFIVTISILNFIKEALTHVKMKKTIRQRLAKNLSNFQLSLLVVMGLSLLLYAQPSLLAIIDKKPLQLYMFFLYIYVITLFLLIGSGNLLSSFFRLLGRFIQKMQNPVVRRMFFNLKRWQFYSSSYAKLFVHIAFISSLLFALTSSLSHLETTKIAESKIEIGGDLLISGISWDHETLEENIMSINTVTETFSYGYLEFIDYELEGDNGLLHVEVIGIPVDELSSVISSFHSSNLPSQNELKSLFKAANSTLVYGANPVKNFDTLKYLKALNPSPFGQNYYTFPINYVVQKDVFPSSYLFKSESGLNIITSMDTLLKFEESTSYKFKLIRHQTVFVIDESLLEQTKENLYNELNSVAEISIESALTLSELHNKSNSYYPVFDLFIFLSIETGLCLLVIMLTAFSNLYTITVNEMVETVHNPYIRSSSWKGKRLVYDQLVFTLFFVALVLLFYMSFLTYIFSLVTNNPSIFTSNSISIFPILLMVIIYLFSQIMIFFCWWLGKKRADTLKLRKEEVN